MVYMYLLQKTQHVFSASLPQLQEDNLLWRQQPPSSIISDDIFKHAQGRPVQRARLKHAALSITRLMKEKQHLIEMCNRLRGVMSSSGFKGVVTYTRHTELVCLCLFRCTCRKSNVSVYAHLLHRPKIRNYNINATMLLAYIYYCMEIGFWP